MKKLILINILILFSIISLILILSPLILDLRQKVHENKKYKLPNYSSITWAKKHFEEIDMLRTTYYDYIGWRRNDFNGETIKIENGYRLNNLNENFNIKKDIWIFGGSTVWGDGSRNKDTIPSFIEKLSGFSVLNLGEHSYTTTQELNLLNKEIVKHKPKIIIFYDGVNDVYSKCLKQSNYFSGYNENEIRKKVSSKYPYTKKLFEAPLEIINLIINKFEKKNKKIFDCDLDKDKSIKISKVFFNNWQIVKSIAEKNDIKFIPILQPTAFSSESNLTHLTLSNELKKQYNIIYELIKKELDEYDFDYLNLENSLNDKEFYFIDFCHLSPNGNYVIASKIVNSDLFQN